MALPPSPLTVFKFGNGPSIPIVPQNPTAIHFPPPPPPAAVQEPTKCCKYKDIGDMVLFIQKTLQGGKWFTRVCLKLGDSKTSMTKEQCRLMIDQLHEAYNKAFGDEEIQEDSKKRNKPSEEKTAAPVSAPALFPQANVVPY